MAAKLARAFPGPSSTMAPGWMFSRADCSASVNTTGCTGCLVQYPGTSGRIDDLRPIVERAHQQDALVAVAAESEAAAAEGVSKLDVKYELLESFTDDHDLQAALR